MPRVYYKYPGNGFYNCKNVSELAGLKETYDKDWTCMWIRNQYTTK